MPWTRVLGSLRWPDTLPLGAVGETPVEPTKTGSRCEEVVKSVQTLMMG